MRLFSLDWLGCLLLGNSLALWCHGPWERGMSHSSIPTGPEKLLPCPQGLVLLEAIKEALPCFFQFSAETESGACLQAVWRVLPSWDAAPAGTTSQGVP